MATMVKEKRREKKKLKEKTSTSIPKIEKPCQPIECEEIVSLAERVIVGESPKRSEMQTEVNIGRALETDTEIASLSSDNTQPVSELQAKESTSLSRQISKITHEESKEHIEASYLQCNLNLDKLIITEAISVGSEAMESHLDISEGQCTVENFEPSAPVFEEATPQITYRDEVTVTEKVIVLQSMPLEEAMRQFEGAEMAQVMALSEVEEALVNTGPMSSPEHPLVDLLSTFRRALTAVDRERIQTQIAYAEEAKFRSTLWKIDKKFISETHKCKCGLDVHFKVKYDHAELQMDKLPIECMKLKAQLKDVQECYCHHLHSALLAYYQIEEYIAEVVKGNKGEIRESLSLVLQALKLSDCGPAVLSTALQRWAAALAHALVDQRDLRQLLFLIHHLFRQTHSVRWAADIIDISVNDSVGAARVMALIDVLFSRTAPEAAVECVEVHKEDVWEEVDKDGGGGAVSEGALRERDLLALLNALPLRDLVARILLFTQSDVREYSWAAAGAGSVVRACCGVRVLVRVVRRVGGAHAAYPRLRAAVRALALRALQGLAALHDHSRASYSKVEEYRVLGELQAAFVSGMQVLEVDQLHALPASLLAEHSAKDYCTAHMVAVQQHVNDNSRRVESLSIELPSLPCAVRVRIVCHAAVDRRTDYVLARLVLDFLFQLAIRRNTTITLCKGACRLAAREAMAELLAAHSFLYPIALHQIAETNTVEKLDASSLECMNLEEWRPQCGEIYAVLEDWLQRCPQLLEPMLLRLHYEPYTGVTLASQLVVGSWLRRRAAAAAAEWPWRLLRRLRLHHALWAAPDPADPDDDPADLFSKAYALMATSWGHCLPLICSVGVEALCSIAATRTIDAVHCLAPIALVLATSPESVAATPRFTDLFAMIINAGPGLVQRVIGRGGATGADLLLRLVREQLRDTHTGGVGREALTNLWIIALWRTAASAALLDAALCSLPQCPQLQHYADVLALAQDEQTEKQIMQAMKWSSQAPLVAESALRAWHTQHEHHTQLFPRLLDALHAQRTLKQRIHVNNALKMLRASIVSEELVIYRVSGAVLVASLSHPALLLLWRLLMHLYLQRPPCDSRESTPPVGPLFFSGLINGGTFTQLKRRLTDVIKYHGDELVSLKNKLKTNTPKPSTSRSKSNSLPADNDVTPPLSIKDINGELSDSSESEAGDDDTEEISQQDNDQEKRDVADMLSYHTGAERMFCEYARWLEQGPNTTAMPHHADIARFIPEHALRKAFLREADRRKPVIQPDIEPVQLPPAIPPPPTPPPRIPFQDAKDALLKIKDRSRKRSPKVVIQSPLSNTDIKDARKLISIVHQYLKDIEQLAQEWRSDVGAVSALNKSLVPLLRALRVPRPLPTLRAVCAKKCKPMEYLPSGREWCISSGAEKGIKENRKNAKAALKKLMRARPEAARRSAALLALVRHVGSAQVAVRVVESVWQTASRVSGLCAPVADLLTSMLELLADRWLVSNGRVCEDLLTRWSGGQLSELQQRLLAALVVPQRLSPAFLPGLHTAVLKASLPPHALFSCLSKFELSSWSLSVDSDARRSLLASLSMAAQRWAPSADQDIQLLLELVGVQTAAVCSPAELPEVVRAGVEACVQGLVPASHLRHIVTAARKCALHLLYDQLGHLLRELGVLWWNARTGLKGSTKISPSVYAAHMAELLQVLHSAFVATAIHLSYAPEKVATAAWSSAQEAWSPWILPHVLPPLLSAVGEDSYCDMLKLFARALQQVIVDCPGTEAYLLGHVFEWVIRTHGGVYNCTEQQARVQLSTLLVEVSKLPWQRQWLRTAHIQALVQISQCNDKEIHSWCASCVKTQSRESWLSDAGDQLSVHLAALLYLFTTSPITFHLETLETACRLPWSRLPELALDEGLERFFAQNHGITTPYHDLPQFRVILSASEIYSTEGSLNISDVSKQKRCRVTSLWTRATSAPALLSLAPKHASAILTMLTDIACLVESYELQQLLERALVIMCIEPAASAVVSTWENFIVGSDARMLRAILPAVAGLTVFDHFSTLADIAIKAYLAQECGDWATVLSLWRSCLWLEPTPLCLRARVHAAYAALRADRDSTRTDYGILRTAMLALIAADINFIQNEAIVSVWICVSCLTALNCGTEGEAAECAGAAKGLLTRWGAKRPLLSLGGDSKRPTPRHRLLCLLAQCILTPGDENSIRTYESACSSLLGSSPDVAAWGRTPQPRKLLRLAVRLFPQAEKYFKKELDLTPDDKL